jgi:hypothetical protein
VLIKTPSPSGLPLKADGSVDLNGLPAGTLAGQVKPFGAGKSCAGTFTLTPGSYAMICNIVAKGDDGAHFQRGMVNVFNVS